MTSASSQVTHPRRRCRCRWDCCADRLAERDVDIIERGQQLNKVIEEYKDLVSRQKYCEQEMQRLEALVNVRLLIPHLSSHLSVSLCSIRSKSARSLWNG